MTSIARRAALLCAAFLAALSGCGGGGEDCTKATGVYLPSYYTVSLQTTASGACSLYECNGEVSLYLWTTATGETTVDLNCFYWDQFKGSVCSTSDGSEYGFTATANSAAGEDPRTTMTISGSVKLDESGTSSIGGSVNIYVVPDIGASCTVRGSFTGTSG